MTQRAIIATHARHNCAYFWLRTFQNDTTLAGALCPAGVFFCIRKRGGDASQILCEPAGLHDQRELTDDF